jgi:hypothetical protein
MTVSALDVHDLQTQMQHEAHAGRRQVVFVPQPQQRGWWFAFARMAT